MSSWRKSSPSTKSAAKPAAGSRRPKRAGRDAASERRGPGCLGAVTWHAGMRARAVLIVDFGGEKVLGPRFVRLLEEIDRAGSVRQAALALGLGYRHAIAWIHRAEAALERPLVVRRAGGREGGGSGLTHEGVLLIHQYHRVSRALGKVVARAEHDILEG